MRKLLLTRGAPGSGKSSVIRELGLSDYTVNFDDIKLMLQSPQMNSAGQMEISKNRGEQVWHLSSRILDDRMNNGDFFVVDSTLQQRAPGDDAANSLFGSLYDLARRRGYKIACLDFSTMPLERAIAQNRRRPQHRRVPDEVVERIYQNIHYTLPDDIAVFPWDADGRFLDDLDIQWLQTPLHDLSSYDEVVHVGDIQGCFEPLAGSGGLLEQGFRDNAFYIFVGDLLDRGPENGKVLRWYLENALPRDNVVLLWGNHEDHVVRWVAGEEGVSDEFNKRTLPQIEAEGITREDVRPLVDKLHECFLYRWNGRNVMVSHGGLSNVPADPLLVSGHQYSRGTGNWEEDVDAQFERNAPENWYQVHGHRNRAQVPLLASDRSFNLEASVELGGYLRALRLDHAGFTPIQIKNRSFVPYRQRLRDWTKVVPDWMKRQDDGGLIADRDVIEEIRNHTVRDKPAVRFRPSETFPHVSSVNFSKHVFYKAAWDDISVRARGLFINNETNEIVARSYDKFFNLNERQETTMEALEAGLTYPVTVYTKENGYLGILGYDSVTDELVFASKSTTEGFFAENFQRIFKEKVGTNQLDKLKRYLRDMEASMVFEVIDPVNDPHIIEYEKEDLILLDVFRRALETEKLPYKDLKRLAGIYGLEAKERKVSLNNWKQVEGFLKAALAPGYTVSGKHMEGFVFEDAEGFQTKIKLHHYNFWKAMRTVKERVRVAIEKDKDMDAIQPDFSNDYKSKIWSQPEAVPFLHFCKQLTLEELNQDILTLKAEFERRQILERGRSFVAP